MRQVLRALRIGPTLWKLGVAVRAWLQSREIAAQKRAAKEFVERDTDRYTPVTPRSLRHAWNVYAPWAPGEQERRRLQVPYCALCLAEMTNANEEGRCPWFNSP